MRAFDDCAVAPVQQTDEDRIEGPESQNAQLRQRVADLGFPCERQIDENKAKQAEQHSKIAHFSKQMQAFREEAAEKDIEVLKLKTVSADTGHEQHVELVDLTWRPPRWRPNVTTALMQQTSAKKGPSAQQTDEDRIEGPGITKRSAPPKGDLP